LFYFDAETDRSFGRHDEGDQRRLAHHVMGPNLREPDMPAPNYSEFNRFSPFTAIYFAFFGFLVALIREVWFMANVWSGIVKQSV
jgi:hypothetical protein